MALAGQPGHLCVEGWSRLRARNSWWPREHDAWLKLTGTLAQPERSWNKNMKNMKKTHWEKLLKWWISTRQELGNPKKQNRQQKDWSAWVQLSQSFTWPSITNYHLRWLWFLIAACKCKVYFPGRWFHCFFSAMWVWLKIGPPRQPGKQSTTTWRLSSLLVWLENDESTRSPEMIGGNHPMIKVLWPKCFIKNIYIYNIIYISQRFPKYVYRVYSEFLSLIGSIWSNRCGARPARLFVCVLKLSVFQWEHGSYGVPQHCADILLQIVYILMQFLKHIWCILYVHSSCMIIHVCLHK